MVSRSGSFAGKGEVSVAAVVRGWIALSVSCCLWLPAVAAEHPTLVSVEDADCSFCHEELIVGKKAVHPPAAEDCSACHEFSVTDEATEVALMLEEPALCLVCHDDKTAAAEGDLEVPHYPAVESCLSCHDPHAADHPGLLQASTAETCAFCHDTEELNAAHDDQLHAATDCASCHDPHGSANERMLLASGLHRPFAEGSCNGCHRKPFGERVRLRARGERLCTACHGDPAEAAAGGGSVHAALKGKKGVAGCLSCHQPHMSDAFSLLDADGPALCADCHAGVVEASTAESGHYPAGDDCSNCHAPHAAESPHLLTAPAQELCAGCHEPTDEELAAAHLGADPAELACLDCHTPHGSGHDSLMADHLHDAVLMGCDTCHEGGHDQLMEDGDSPLCLVCHEDVGDAAAAAPVPHAAMELGRCVDCHNPHASPQPQLVRSAQGQFCTDCHDAQAAGEGEFLHGVIDLIGCQACHEPHGGSNEKLLRVTGDELCLACHDPSRLALDGESPVEVLGRFEIAGEQAARMASLILSDGGTRGHPLRGHLVRGQPTEEARKRADSTFTGELSCLACHDPHKGRSPKLFRWGVANVTQACQHCHPK
jgi:predicted CXXCH cytochrome family protein